MNYIKGYRCTICGKFFETQEDLLTCPECGETGILDIQVLLYFAIAIFIYLINIAKCRN